MKFWSTLVDLLVNILDHFGWEKVKIWVKMWKHVFGVVFRDIFSKILMFPSIFSLLRVVWSWFYHWRIAQSLENVLNTQNICRRCFFATLLRFEVKVLVRNCQKSVFWIHLDSPKILSQGHFFKNPDVLFNSFTFM